MGKLTFKATVVDTGVKFDSKAEEIMVVTKFKSELGAVNVAALAGLVNQDVTIEITSAQMTMFDSAAGARYRQAPKKTERKKRNAYVGSKRPKRNHGSA
jgi:hypothetical protein